MTRSERISRYKDYINLEYFHVELSAGRSEDRQFWVHNVDPRTFHQFQNLPSKTSQLPPSSFLHLNKAGYAILCEHSISRSPRRGGDKVYLWQFWLGSFLHSGIVGRSK